jgi:hypothetical protein
LHILPNIPSFQHLSAKTHDNRPMADFILIHKRLSNAGLLIYNEMICTSDDVIHLYEDLLLLAGTVRNQITKCVYEAPIFIKRSLSKQGLKLLEGPSITKILILPRTPTAEIRNNLFTDSSLIHHILDNETKRDFGRISNDSKQSKGTPMQLLEHTECKNQTCLTNRIHEQYHINDDNRYTQAAININRLLLATGKKLTKYSK